MRLFSWLRGKPPDFEALIRKLTTGSDAERRAAAATLGRIGFDSIRPLYSALFFAGEENIPWVGRAFREMGGAGLKCLRTTLEQQASYESRRQALKALEAFGAAAAGAIADLIRSLEDVDPEVRWRSARVLGLVGPAAKPALPALEKCKWDKDSKMSTEVQTALKAIRGGTGA